MNGYSVAHCAAYIVVYFEEEEKKDTGRVYKSHKLMVNHDGSFLSDGHEFFDAGDIALMDFREDMKDRIDTGVAVHAAYHQSSQHKPRVAERLVKGWQSMRNMAYRHAKKDGTTMPSDPKGIGRYLKDRDLDGNLYEQVLRREIYDKEKTTQEV